MATIRNRAKPARTRPHKGRPLALERPALLPVHGAPWWHWVLASLLVLAVSLVVYWPTLDNGFVNWDDFDYLTKNDKVANRGGLADIWNPFGKQEQYYPMVFSSYWLEHKLILQANGEQAKDDYSRVPHLERGFEPWIFHLDNMILHALVGALLIGMLRLLGVSPWVAWLTAALFAVHPINVASVAWAAERKNVLSGLFYVLSLTFYLRNTRRFSWLSYVLCLVLYVLALLSKSAMVTLPATAVLCDRLIERRWRWQSWARVAPMLLLGVVSAGLTKWHEANNAGVTMVPVDQVLRPFAAAGAIWFYVGKILVPYHFPGVYSRWDLRGSWLLFTAALAALPLAAWLVWKLRRRIPGPALWGMGHFVLSLSPMLGLVAFNYTQFSFVADHFVYLSSVGLLVCVALAADHLRGRGRTESTFGRSAGVTALACAVLAGLGAFSYRHNSDVWKDGQTFWRYTLELNPGCWPGHYNLGNIYGRRATPIRKAGRDAERQGRPEEAAELKRQWQDLLTKAAECYRKAAGTKAGLYQAHAARGRTLSTLGRTDEAITEYRAAVKLRPKSPRYLASLGRLLERNGQADQAVQHYQAIIKNNVRNSPGQVRSLLHAFVRLASYRFRQGQIDQAITLYKRALEIDPDMAAAQRGLNGARRALEQGQSLPAGR